MRFLHRALPALAAILLAAGAAAADTFVVTTTQDSGLGSLREAIECSNSHAGPDTVLFAIPIGDPGHDAELGVWRIQADEQFPDWYPITDDSTFIDGCSQAQFVGGDPNPHGPEIELQGPSAGAPQYGIDIIADDNVIRGLCVHHFRAGAIAVSAGPPGESSERNTITGCYLNVDPTGSQRAGYAADGIVCGSASGLRIGGDAPDDRNIISGGEYGEIATSYSGTVEIINNLIGTDRTGTADLSRHWHEALLIGHPTGPFLVKDNVIVGDRRAIVSIGIAESDSAIVTFVGNRVGVGLDGNPMGGDHVNIEVDYSPGHVFKDNTVAYAQAFGGIVLDGENTDYVTFSRNSIYGNAGLGINLFQYYNESGTGVDYVDGVYGPDVNEEIDPPLCDSIVTSPVGTGGTTTAYFRCMPNCVAEVFIGDPGDEAGCSEPGYGAVHSGITYLGDAAEIVKGAVWSTYMLSVSPALPAGTFVTATATNENGSTSEFGCSCQVPAVGTSGPGCLPTEYRFGVASPNPCTESVVLRYQMPKAGRVQIGAYDVRGNLRAEVLDEYQAEGIYAVRWRPGRADGAPLPNGLYLLRLAADDFVASRKVVVLR